MSRILVTGADGFLGEQVVKLLIQYNFDFIGVSRRKARENYIYCDLSNPTDVIKMLDKTQSDVIINLASRVDFKENKLKYFFPVNVLLPAILGNYCEKKKSYLVHSSGTIVHGLAHNIYNINTELAPNTGYGKSKLLADELIIASGCKHSILRFGGIFGKDGPQHLGINKAISNSFDGVIPSIIGSGKTKRNYIYVKDAAEAILKCVDENITGINYIGGEIKTVNGMLNDICEVFNLGREPSHIKGQNSADQVIENSIHLNITPFKTALEQMI